MGSGGRTGGECRAAPLAIAKVGTEVKVAAIVAEG